MFKSKKEEEKVEEAPKPEEKVETSKEEKKEELKQRIVVVKELPTQVVREALSEDGKTTLNFVTVEEALTNIMNQ